MSLLLLGDVRAHTHTPTHSIFKTEACSQVFNHLWHPEAEDVTGASALKAFNIRERWRCLTVLLVDAIVACCFSSPVYIGFSFLFFKIRKSKKPNQTFSLRVHSAVTFWVATASDSGADSYWMGRGQVHKNVSSVDAVQLSGLIAEGNLTGFRWYRCSGAGNGGQRCVKHETGKTAQHDRYFFFKTSHVVMEWTQWV